MSIKYDYTGKGANKEKTGTFHISKGDIKKTYTGSVVNGHVVFDTDAFIDDFGVTNSNALIHLANDDYFKSMDDTALAWSLMYSPSVQGDLEERGSIIYATGLWSNQYRFSEPALGTRKIDNGKEVIETQFSTSPNKGAPFAYIHSHPAVSQYSEVFSQRDIFAIMGQSSRTSYISTAGGTLQKWYHNNGPIQHSEITGKNCIPYTSYRDLFPEAYTSSNLPF